MGQEGLSILPVAAREWIVLFVIIGVALTAFGLIRSDMREKVVDIQAQLDRRLNAVDRQLEKIGTNQERITDRLEDERERLAAMERELKVDEALADKVKQDSNLLHNWVHPDKAPKGR